MNILHVITSLRTGGAEHLMVNLLPRLRDLGNNVELLLFDGTRTPFYEQLESNGIKIHSLGVGGNVYNPINIFKLAKYIHKYDIVHTHNTACQLFVPFAKVFCSCKTKIITTEHNTTNRRRDKWYLKPIDKWMYSKYNAIICISDSTAYNLMNHIGQKDKIVTINNGICVSSFIRPPKKIIKENIKKIIMVAAFREQKDHETLLRAISELPEDYYLYLVGDGVRRNTVESLCHQLELNNRVSFLGVRNDIPDLYEEADVAVLSSHWEGFGLSAVEAMASGTPTIASDVPGLSEVVSDYGVLFPQGDHRALASAIRKLCDDSHYYSEVAKRCQTRAKEFDISIMTQKYNELYYSL